MKQLAFEAKMMPCARQLDEGWMTAVNLQLDDAAYGRDCLYLGAHRVKDFS
jgi:hypothetical protein